MLNFAAGFCKFDLYMKSCLYIESPPSLADYSNEEGGDLGTPKIQKYSIDTIIPLATLIISSDEISPVTSIR